MMNEMILYSTRAACMVIGRRMMKSSMTLSLPKERMTALCLFEDDNGDKGNVSERKQIDDY